MTTPIERYRQTAEAILARYERYTECEEYHLHDVGTEPRAEHFDYDDGRALDDFTAAAQTYAREIALEAIGTDPEDLTAEERDRTVTRGLGWDKVVRNSLRATQRAALDKLVEGK